VDAKIIFILLSWWKIKKWFYFPVLVVFRNSYHVMNHTDSKSIPCQTRVNCIAQILYPCVFMGVWVCENTKVYRYCCMCMYLSSNPTWLIINFELIFFLLSQWNFNQTSRGMRHPKGKKKEKKIVKSGALKFNLYTWHMTFKHWAIESISTGLSHKLSQVKMYVFRILHFCMVLFAILYVILCIVLNTKLTII